MNLEVLVATMHQKDYSLLEKMNISSNAVVINQCDSDSVDRFEYKNYSIIWVNTTQRGLSRSRNMALSFASADICLIADEDVKYFDDYSENILNAFEHRKEADIITFNFKKTNGISTRKPRVDRKAPFYRSYASVSIAFRLIKIRKNGLHFNDLIGAGSQFGSGEESLFLIESRRKHLKIYESPYYICTVDFSKSSWFDGYNEKFYVDTGVYLAITYRRFAYVYMLYFLLQSRKLSNLSSRVVLKNILNGIKLFYDL